MKKTIGTNEIKNFYKRKFQGVIGIVQKKFTDNDISLWSAVRRKGKAVIVDKVSSLEIQLPNICVWTTSVYQQQQPEYLLPWKQETAIQNG